MKTITLKDTTIVKEGTTMMSYADLMKACLFFDESGKGFGYQKIRDLNKIADKIDAAVGTLELEDAEAKTLSQHVEGMQWRIAHKDLVPFSVEVIKECE